MYRKIVLRARVAGERLLIDLSTRPKQPNPEGYRDVAGAFRPLPAIPRARSRLYLSYKPSRGSTTSRSTI